MERKEWPPPPLAGVLSLPTAWGTASQGGGWGESGGQTQVHRRRLEALLEPLAFSEVSGFLLKKKKNAMVPFLSPANPPQPARLLWSLMLVAIMIILKLCHFYYYILLTAVHANLPTEGIACLKVVILRS